MLKRDLDQITPEFVEAVEDAAGSSSVGWDLIDPRELILAVLEVAESRKWISVEDELPPVGVEVLLFARGFGCVVGIRLDSGEYRDTFIEEFNCSPTHWQPLPPPPEK